MDSNDIPQLQKIEGEASIVADGNEKQNKPEEDSELWEVVGFHRPLAGFFFNIPLDLLAILISLAITATIFDVIYPFPESLGYKSIVSGLFVLLFQVFDLGTADVVNRFVGEYYVKDPKRMIHYIQYFIWYQMFTGLIQTTSIAIYALYFVPQTELSYTVWLMLLLSTHQYPGMLNIFKSNLAAIQHHDKFYLVDFIGGEFFERITDIGLILVGKWWGSQNPVIGELFGIAIMSCISKYVDDFLATILSAHYFGKIIEPFGYSIKDCFGHDFDKELLIECTSWGIKNGAPSLLSSVVSLVELNLWLAFIPQYSTFLSLATLSRNFAGLMRWKINLGGAISESYQNGKVKLTQHYVQESFRYTGLIQSMMFSVILLILLVIEPLILAFLENVYYLGMIAFIIPQTFKEARFAYLHIGDSLILGTGKINVALVGKIIDFVMSLVNLYLMIGVFKIQNYGFIGIVFVISFDTALGYISRILFYFIYIDRKVLKLNIPWFQAYVAPIMSGAVYYGLSRLYFETIYQWTLSISNVIIAVIPMAIIFILFAPFFLYFPLTAYFGSWTDESIQVLEKSRKISGLAKPFIIPMIRMVRKAQTISPLAKRFKVDTTDAVREANELMQLKMQHKKK